MISIVPVRANIDNNFLPWKRNHKHFEYVNENGYSSDPNYLENELLFLYEYIKKFARPSEPFLEESSSRLSARSSNKTAEQAASRQRCFAGRMKDNSPTKDSN
jgi:hypothetical protein